MRSIIPESEQIVALDTKIGWELRNTEPDWLKTFVSMSQSGYHFCISDIFIAEFLNQLEAGRLTPAEFMHAVKQMDRFISGVLPILPGKRQLYQMAGIHNLEMPPAEDPVFTQAYSIATWNWMKSITDHASLNTNPTTFTYNGQISKHPFQPSVVNAELQLERDRWIAWIESFDSVPKDTLYLQRDEKLAEMRNDIDSDSHCVPTASTRYDLFLKFLLETAIQRNQSNGTFNPKTTRRQNDAIDSLLLLAFLLPGFVCTTDTPFVSRFDPIKSFQKEWFVTPNQLVTQWINGTNPRTIWPENIP